MTTGIGAEPSLRFYFLVMRRRKWWVIGLALLGLAVSLALSVTQPNQYSATAQLLVQPSGVSGALGTVQEQVTPTDVQTSLQLVNSGPVRRGVTKELGSAPPIAASQVAQTDIIGITAISTSPAQAAVIANAYANAFVKHQRAVTFSDLAAAELQLRTQIRTLGKQIRTLRASASATSEVAALVNQQAVLKEQLAQMQVSGTITTGGLALVTPAVAPTSRTAPKPAQDGVLGLLAGLFLGLGAAFLRDNLDDAITSKEAAEQIGGAPVLALVPMVTSWKRRDKPLVVSISSPTSPAAEAYRSLRTSLQFARQERDLQTILVTSPAAAEGKTSTLANLGAVFAQAGQRVVLVSCDLRRPRLGKFFGLDEEIGLTTVMLGQHTLGQAVQPVPRYAGLSVLGAGPLPPNPAELLNGIRAREVFAALRQEFDLVLIDSPPLLPVTDAVVLSTVADAALLVVAAGQTKRGELQRAAEKLAQVEAPVVGIILNEVTRQGASGYDAYRYGYGTYVSDAPGLPPANVPVQANGHGPVPAGVVTKRGRRPR